MNRKEFVNEVVQRLKDKLQDWVFVETQYFKAVDNYDIRLCFKINDSQYCLCFNDCIFDKFYMPFMTYINHEKIDYTDSDIEHAVYNIRIRANELIARLIWKGREY